LLATAASAWLRVDARTNQKSVPLFTL